MARFKMVNGVKVNLTSEEEAIRDQEESQAAIDKQAEIDAKINKENKKASGKQKLLDLGLTEEEVKALIGV
tara:strand:+ start:569 stop:781 length:213 start_codon:yes stop_codon:yes gene_type:complete